MDDREAEYRCAMAMREWWIAMQLEKGRRAVLPSAKLALFYRIRGDVDKVWRVG